MSFSSCYSSLGLREAMGHVGRHRSFGSQLALSSHSDSRAISGIIGEYCGGAASGTQGSDLVQLLFVRGYATDRQSRLVSRREIFSNGNESLESPKCIWEIESGIPSHFGARDSLPSLLVYPLDSSALLHWRSSPNSYAPSSQFPTAAGIQATSTELGLGFRQRQDLGISLVTLLKFPWSIYPLSSHGSSGQIRRPSYSSMWMRSAATSSVDLGEAQVVNQLWNDYFADPSQWWDNSVDKTDSRSPDFKHKVAEKALWIDIQSTPPWVKAKLKLITKARLATNMLKNRVQQGININTDSFIEVLKRCLKQKDIISARQVHDSMIKSGMDKNPYVATTLLNVYIRCGTLQDARRVFDELEKKSVLTWNIMIGGYAKNDHAEDALELFNQMRQGDAEPDKVTYLSILKACASPLSLKWGKDVHAYIRHAGLESDVRVGTALLQMYAKCGCITEARQVFERMTNRNVITWNVMISAYAENSFAEEAYQLFLQMKREGFKPDAISYTSLLNARPSTDALKWVKEVHNHVLVAGVPLDLWLGNALLNAYAKTGSIADSRLAFDRMKERDVTTWNVMIGAYVEYGFGVEARQLFLQMKRENFKPDAITYVSILNGRSSAGALEWVKEVHGHALESGLELDLRVCSALVHMYAKSGSIHDARLVFDRMKERNVITWTVMIGGLAQHGLGREAYGLFLQMQKEGCKPDVTTYVSILNAVSSAGALDWVTEVHRHAMEAGLESDLRVGNALVHMYAKSGSIDDARLVFDRIRKRDVVTWTAMIGGLAHHGFGHEALEFFRRMDGDGVKPNGYTLVAVLSACRHAGLLDEGRQLFGSMMQDYGIEPTVVHYTCVVDLLGRAGHLEEAKQFIGNMPMEPDGATWGALLGACRTYGNVELGEIVAKEVLKLEPNDSSTYVLLSNIYAGAGKWDMVSSVRSMMLERGIRKEPGRSWVEVDGKIHNFVVGDVSHQEAKEIYAEVNRLTERIKAEGYISDTRHVLQNIDEEDKEFSLCSHSEKLAITYGLMRSPHGKPIRVYKNLRVCSDCHAATKFISKVTGREIVARDANRFHHFKDGNCSCGDYW